MTSNKTNKNSDGNTPEPGTIFDRTNDPELTSLFEFWNKVRGDRLIPLAADIDPAQIAHLLKDIAIFDVLSETDIRYRLAGTSVAERMGTDPTGANVLELTAPEARDFVSGLLHQVVTHPAGALVRYQNVYESGKQAIVLSLLLPLSDSNGGAPRILSIHSRDETLLYGEERTTTLVAAQIDEVDWIDIGAGVPDRDQADG